MIKNMDWYIPKTIYIINRTLTMSIRQKGLKERIEQVNNGIEGLRNKIDNIPIIKNVDKSTFLLENKSSGKYVDVFGSQNSEGTPIIQFEKTMNSNQKFKIKDGLIISVCNNKPIGWEKRDNIDYLQIKEDSFVKKRKHFFKPIFVKQTKEGNVTKKWYNIEVSGDSNWVWQTCKDNIIVAKKRINNDSQLFCLEYCVH